MSTPNKPNSNEPINPNANEYGSSGFDTTKPGSRSDNTGSDSAPGSTPYSGYVESSVPSSRRKPGAAAGTSDSSHPDTTVISTNREGAAGSASTGGYSSSQGSTAYSAGSASAGNPSGTTGSAGAAGTTGSAGSAGATGSAGSMGSGTHAGTYQYGQSAEPAGNWAGTSASSSAPQSYGNQYPSSYGTPAGQPGQPGQPAQSTQTNQPGNQFGQQPSNFGQPQQGQQAQSQAQFGGQFLSSEQAYEIRSSNQAYGADQPYGANQPYGQQQQFEQQQFDQMQQFDKVPQEKGKGFFSSLFDFSFREFVTIDFVKIIYIVLLVAAAVFWVLGLIGSFSGFEDGAGTGIMFLLGWLIFGTLATLLQIILIRVGLEALVSVVRIAQNTTDLVDEEKGAEDAVSVDSAEDTTK
ncbi:DUF4282 domain-containing protein [Corynebacterium sp. CCUG 65737]|uniref:DUF4282 domain-containing protein n=1 Tax=Corynebacterium sp. CCUG 65737 TaxID=2823889 RepID=UPI00210EEE8C|nr:DUF4282 domain-containing protein [Corynebacterium sp. CCUG 65737]